MVENTKVCSTSGMHVSIPTDLDILMSNGLC